MRDNFLTYFNNKHAICSGQVICKILQLRLREVNAAYQATFYHEKAPDAC